MEEEEKKKKKKKKEEEMNVCTLTYVYSDLQYLPVLPTFLSHLFSHCPDIPAAGTAEKRNVCTVPSD